MKRKLSKEQIDSILEDPEKVRAAGVKTSNPWWFILLKVLAYGIGLFVGGTVFASCASHIF